MFHLRLLFTALRGLRQNLVRSMLATLGVIIGVGAVVAAVSVLQGAERNVLGQVEKLGADQALVFNGTGRREHRVQPKQSLLPEDADLIQRENEGVVKAVAPQYQDLAQIKYLERNAVANILGTTQAYAEINDCPVEHGRFLTRQDVQGNSMTCVLGFKVASDLFGELPAIGKSVKINGKSFVVVGTMEERGGQGFMEVDKQVFIPLSTAMSRMFGAKYLTMIAVQCADGRKLAPCIDRVKKSLRGAHHIKAGDGEDFEVYTQEQIKRQFGEIAQIFGIVLYSIAGISLVVGAIGIMNIMLVSVTERTREIGVRIAVGARRFDILKQFLIEAGIISLLGGALGVVCGWAMANFLSEFTQVLQTHTPQSIVVIALIMAGVVGMISGIYPAIRAARLDPVQALRFE